MRPGSASGSSPGGADLEEMHAAGTLDVDRVIGVLTRYLGADDPQIARLQEL